MPKFTVRFEETQDWVFEYEVDAKDETTALDIARGKFYDGDQGDAYCKDSQMTGRSVIKNVEENANA